jgi:pimeloyl-ACP methyl ester carboxylesterase
LRVTLRELEDDPAISSVHFLTHSLGGILARHAAEWERFPKIRRLVMLAPPNSGSHLTALPMGPFAHWFPAIAELSESPNSLPNRLKTPNNIEIGIIAAASDFIVRVANTYLENQREHCVITASHFRLPYLEEVLYRASLFLRHGTFRPCAIGEDSSYRVSRKAA